MQTRPLGRGGPPVSEIGFGTWGLGGDHDGAIAYGPTDDPSSRDALRRALALGVTFFDTSDLYGNGHAEKLLGEVLREHSCAQFVSTKAGFLDPDGNQSFDLGHLERAFAGSRSRLGLERVGMFMLHSPPLELLEREPAVVEWALDLRARGLAETVGVSVRTPAEGREVIGRWPGFRALQVNYNLTDQRARESGLLDAAAEAGVGLVIRTPLCFGYLAAAFDEALLPESDHRQRNWSAAQREAWDRARLVFASARADGVSPARFALRFCLSHPAVSTVIPGMLTTEHVDDNVGASSEGPLAAEDLAAIEALYAGEEFFVRTPR